MKHLRLPFLALAICAFAFASLGAQESPANKEPLLEALKEQALQIQVLTRQVDAAQTVLWSRDASWVTVPGRSVSLRLEGETTLIVTQFTPYRRGTVTQLLVQTQVWVRDKEKNTMRNYTHINNLNVTLGEKILYYPLGKRRETSADAGPEMEMSISITAFTETPEETSP